MKVRLLVVAMAVLGTVAGCGGGAPDGEEGLDDGSGVVGTVSNAPSASASGEPPAAATAPPAGTPAPGLTCDQLLDASVGAVAFPLADFGGAGLIQLSGGRYTAPEGTVIELLPACATGDLNGDGAVDAVAAVRIDPEGTATLYTLVAWLATDSGAPALAGSEGLGDRNPVQSISIADGIVTVVYFTRTADVPLAGLNVRRTATYEFTEPGLGELSHSDESCGPCNP